MAKVYAGWPYNLCQMGRESTPGTPVAATTVWVGLFASPEDDRNRNVAESDIGRLVALERTYDTVKRVNIPLPSTELTYEQAPHIFEAGLMTATPSGSGDFTRAYSFPLGTTPPTIKTYTLELGNVLVSSDVHEVPYCFVRDFELSGAAEEAWMIQANWRGQQMLQTGFTPSLAVTVPEVAKFGNTRLYINNSGSAPGTTQLTGILMKSSIRIETGIREVPAGDGNLYYIAHKFTKPMVTFTITMELEQDGGASVVAAERAKWDEDAYRIIRLQCPGTSNRNMTIDMAAKYTRVGGYEKEGDGNTVVTFEGRASYSPADALYYSATFVNKIAAYGTAPN